MGSQSERAPSEPVPGLVTLHLWRVPARRVPAALARVARDRRPVRAAPGVLFAKLFARFAVLQSAGTIDGRDPLG